MTDIMETKKYFLQMVASIINEQPIPACPASINLSQLYKLASQNAVLSFLFLAAKNGGITLPEAIENSLKNTYMTNLVRDVSQAEEREYIRQKFSEEDIDFMFLKGSHLKELYPFPEIRYMVDMDVLVHEKDLKKGRKILLERGFSQYKDNGKDIIFTKKPCLTIELHQMLFVEDYFMHDYFVDVWERAENINKHEYKMSYNDLYVYTLAHLAEHYLEAGSCFRPTMDLFLMEKKLGEKLDFSYINEQFEKIGIEKFAHKLRKLYNCMFADCEYDDDLLTMENYIVLGAPVRNAEEAAKAAAAQKTKSQRMVETAFPKLSRMEVRYPILKKLPFLLPIFWIIRIIHYIFTKDATITRKRQQLKNSDQKSTDIMRKIFDRSGL